jgi:hypothetical protein
MFKMFPHVISLPLYPFHLDLLHHLMDFQVVLIDSMVEAHNDLGMLPNMHLICCYTCFHSVYKCFEHFKCSLNIFCTISHKSTLSHVFNPNAFHLRINNMFSTFKSLYSYNQRKEKYGSNPFIFFMTPCHLMLVVKVKK